MLYLSALEVSSWWNKLLYKSMVLYCAVIGHSLQLLTSVCLADCAVLAVLWYGYVSVWMYQVLDGGLGYWLSDSVQHWLQQVASRIPGEVSLTNGYSMMIVVKCTHAYTRTHTHTPKACDQTSIDDCCLWLFYTFAWAFFDRVLFVEFL